MKTHLLKPGENPLEMDRPRGGGKGMLFVYGAVIVLLVLGIGYAIITFITGAFSGGFMGGGKPAPTSTPTITLTATWFPTPTLIVNDTHLQRTPLASRSQLTPSPTLTPKTRFITVPAEVTRERTVVVTKVISGPVQVITKVIKETVVVVITPTLTPTLQASPTATLTPTRTPTNTPRHSPPTPGPTPTLSYTPSYWIFLPLVGFAAPVIDTPIQPSEPPIPETPGPMTEWPAATGTPIPSEPIPYP